ncbi:MAG: 16S rRNA (cytosine(1402)-N(4))-methyltransferase RsmH [Chitinispirillia bacterium]|nr:16S rRNA (cytosine(1402)-N(4))-methyltransferase RsmH [Chitinispirillia bacterium]
MSGLVYHVPVLLNETLSLLVTNNDGIYVDGTLGGGGHFRAIAGILSYKGTAIGIDRDAEAIKNVNENGFADIKAKVIIEQSRFSQFDSVLGKYGIDRIDGLFVDLGVSSRQIDEPERGFMYMKESDLDMRMDQGKGLTARELLEEKSESELAQILEKYGEIRNSRRMAAVIKNYMKHNALLTSSDLKACIVKEYGANVKIQVFAKLFQALRIAVNSELEELSVFLDKSVKYLKEGGRLAVISYHSLEDRMVKEFMRKGEEKCECGPEVLICKCKKVVLFKRITKKVVAATEDEIAKNTRSRSARLRAAQRTAGALS